MIDRAGIQRLEARARSAADGIGINDVARSPKIMAGLAHLGQCSEAGARHLSPRSGRP
jgi:hypothetical protein